MSVNLMKYDTMYWGHGFIVDYRILIVLIVLLVFGFLNAILKYKFWSKRVNLYFMVIVSFVLLAMSWSSKNALTYKEQAVMGIGKVFKLDPANSDEDYATCEFIAQNINNHSCECSGYMRDEDGELLKFVFKSDGEVTFTEAD